MTLSLDQAVRGAIDDVEKIVRVTGGRTAVARHLLEDLREADRLLAARLRRVARSFGDLGSRFTEASALAYQQQVQIMIVYVSGRIRGLTEHQARQAVLRGLQRSALTMERLERRFRGIVRPIRLRQAAQLRATARGVEASLLRQIPTSVDRYGIAMVNQFERVIRAGLLQGSTMDEMVGALTGHRGPRGLVPVASRVTPEGVVRLRNVKVPEGLFVRRRYWAERIVRSEVLRAYNGASLEGVKEMQQEFPDAQKKILAIMDLRTARDSIAVHGQVREFNDEFIDGAGRRYQYPPARPNDRETVIPWRPEWTKEAMDTESLEEREKAGVLTDKERDQMAAKLEARRKRAGERAQSRARR